MTKIKLSLAAIAVAVVLSGCDKKPEEKAVSELSEQEMTQICAAPDVVSQLKAAFAKNTLDSLVATGRIPEQQAQEMVYKQATLDITDGKYLTRNGETVSCEATFSFVPDDMYGRELTNSLRYSVRNAAHKFVPATDFNVKNLVQHKIEPTQRQKELREKQQQERDKQLAEQQKQLAALQAVPDSEFKTISAEDLFQLFFAQKNTRPEDEELLKFFSNRWNNTTDAFAKEDIRKQDLPQIKARLATYENLKNVVVYSDDKAQFNDALKLKTESNENALYLYNSFNSLTSASYDFASKSFPLSDMCGKANFGNRLDYRGIHLVINSEYVPCRIEMDEETARGVSAKLASLGRQNKGVEASGKYYLHISNIDESSNIVNATLLRESIVVKDPDTHEVIFEKVIK